MKVIIWLACTFLVSAVQAQLKGVVYGSTENDKKPLYGAKIILLSSGGRVISDEEGKFELILPKTLPDTLVVSAMGYFPDTIVVDKKDRFIYLEVVLFSEQLLPEVLVTVRKETKSISRLKTLAVEEIGEGELRKAACCNLSESFETNASVDVNMTDAVSGAKQIQMMGLEGVYTQMQFENIPFLNGLESSHGLTSLPGTWIESIQITKGSGTVVNGYESMAGLINIELKKPTEMESFYVNFYGNRTGRSELNLHSGFNLSEKWTSGIFVHGSVMPFEMDENKDGFRDMPVGNNLAFLNRYDYRGSKMEAQFGISAYADNKIGGQIDAIRRDSAMFYNVGLNARHISAFAKTGFFMKKPGRSVGIVYNYKHQEQDSEFGLRKFTGVQDRGYVNVIYDGLIQTTIHKYKIGTNLVIDQITQALDSLSDDRTQIVPGVFAEYTYTGLRLSAVVGARIDHHNQYGIQTASRVHLKYILTEYTDLRVTAGKGWRVPNYMIDNISLMATSRNWVIPDTIVPEVSWNIGGSIIHEMKWFKRKSTIAVDYYYTFFENQLISDQDKDPALIYFSNIDGLSFSHSFQSELSFTPLVNFDIRLAYKYLDVQSRFGDVVQDRVMIPKHRGFVNFAYRTRNKRWEYDLTCSVFGSSRLPLVELAPGELSTQNQSEVWPMIGAQITHVYKKFDFYLGGENLANYRQKDPIIDADQPFSPYFNATRVWAPIFGMNVYFGIRYKIDRKVENKK